MMDDLSGKYKILKSLFDGKIELTNSLFREIADLLNGIVPKEWYGAFAYRFTQCNREEYLYHIC